MVDFTHNQTDKKLEVLEKHIATVYADALKDIRKDSKSFFDWFTEQDEKQREKLEDGKITDKQYEQWKLEQVRKSQRFAILEEKLSDRMTNANVIAAAYINNSMYDIYAINTNFASYELEKLYGDLSFTLYNEDAIKRLIEEEPDLLPSFPRELEVDEQLDLEYNRKQITKTVTSGILQGKSIPKIADDLMQRLTNINQNAAVRNARTAVTSAENAGRQDCYKRAADLGIKVRKRWVATKDGRTRHAHQKLDGQTVDWNEDFKSELGKIKYPGDRTAKPANVYNCRCSMRTVEKEGIEKEKRKMRVRDASGKNVLVDEMTYEEWEAWKNGTN